MSASEIESLFIEIPELKGISVIAVPDTSAAMSRIAQMYLQSVSPRVIAITGSVGKTTTRELSVSVLKSSYRVHSAIKSYNTVIGCSLTILSMPYDTEVLLLELGTNHFGEISEMVSLFPPETAVITEVAPAHLEGFGSVEGVLKAKLEICRSVKLKNIVYNGDNHLLKAAVPAYDGAKKFSVGHGTDDFLRIEDAAISLEDGGASILASYSLNNEKKSYKIPFFGLQQAYNAGYAVILGNLLGVPEDKISASLEAAAPVNGRGVCRKIPDGSWIIDESYNANPSSMGAAIANVLNINKDGRYRLVALLGGMKELGSDSYVWHQKIVDKLKDFDTVVFIGEEWYDSKLVVPENIV
ncbi:MAG: UDP-N-acetylmuramoyl-tripeptide--D-alanyl-D-alanine ligase, partial [Synergistaceae bacterium]